MLRDLKRLREVLNDCDEDGCKFVVCLEILLFYEGGFEENKQSILNFYNESMKLIGKRIKGFCVEVNQTYKKIKKDTLDMLPFWASDKAVKRDLYGLELTDHTVSDTVSDCAFVLYDDGGDPGSIRLLLPLEDLTEDVSWFIELVKRMATGFNLLSGYAGISSHMDIEYESSKANGHVYKISKQFHGVDISDPIDSAEYMEEGIKCVNWLTLINHDFVEQLGGIKAIQKKLTKTEILHKLDNGIMLQAGAEPDFGHIKENGLPSYHRIGKILKPIRITKAVYGRWNSIGGGKNTNEWLARFD